MLSTNCVACFAAGLRRESGASHTLLLDDGNDHLYEFSAPCVDFPWRPNTDGYDDSPSGRMVNIHCSQNGQNGVQTWYAFNSLPSRNLFLSLLKVDKVGPGTALKILARNSSQTILDLIAAGDRAAFCKLPSVGAKTGAAIADLLFKEAPPQPEEVKVVLDASAVAAMRALGYDANPSKEAVRQAMENKPGADTSALVTEALRLMSK